MAVSLSAVPEQWDANASVRRAFRSTGSIFVSTGDSGVPDINIKNAAKNRRAIEPALKAMTAAPRDEIGGCRLFTIAVAEAASPD